MVRFGSPVLPAEGATFTVREVAAQAVVPVRTIRHYVSQEVLPAVEFRSSKTRYGRAFLVRLRAALTLRRRGLHLKGIKEHLAEATMGEMLKLAGYDATPADALAADLVGAERSGSAGAAAGAGTARGAGGTAAGPSLAGGRALPPGFLGGYRPGVGPAHESWEHFEVCPGVKLLVRREADPEAWRVAQEIVAVFGAPGRS